MDRSLPEEDGHMSTIEEKKKMEITMTTQLENPIVTPGEALEVTETREEETGAGHESAATNCVWKINDPGDEDSGDTDSDSSSSSSSSSSSPGFEDDYEGFSQPAPLRTRDEVLLEELPVAEEVFVTLPEEAELQPIGTVSSIVQQLVIIQSLKDTPPLKDNSILFTSHRVAVGKVFEIFGPVASPLYVLRFTSEDQVNSKGLTEGLLLYYAPSIKEYTGYILTQQLTLTKGSDASWKNDEEPPVEALDYSDDEKEQKAKRKIKNTKKAESGNTGYDVVQKPLKQQSNKVWDSLQNHVGSRVQHQDLRNIHCSHTDSYPPPGHTDVYPMYLQSSCSYPPPPPPCSIPCFPFYSPPPPPPPYFFNPAFSCHFWPPNSVPFTDFPFPPPPPPPPSSSSPPH